VGDSGSPLFFIIGDELVLDGLFGTARGGVQVSALLEPLNAAMAVSGFRVTVADLSHFGAQPSPGSRPVGP
jgi:hypothetical protein